MIVLPAFAEDLSSASFIVRNPTISDGGTRATSTSFESVDVLGQNTPGESTSTNFTLQSGFSYTNEPVFTLSSPGSVSFSSGTVSISAQDSTASLSGVTVVNTRATTTSWSLTLTSTNLTSVGATSKIAGGNDTVTFSGSYNGLAALDTAGIYTVEITTGGAVGMAVFKWTDPAHVITTDITTASNVSLSSGISVNFGAATYVTGDKWIIRVDSLDYSSLTIQPGSISTEFGDTGVTAGSNGTFSGSGATSDPRTLMNGSVGASLGKYIQNSNLIQSVHGNTLQGTFQGTITLTLS